MARFLRSGKLERVDAVQMKWRNGLRTGMALLMLRGFFGCSKDLGMESPTVSPAQPLPFEQPSAKGGIAPTAGLLPQGIRVGTRIEARISSALRIDQVQPGDSVLAVLDRPLFFEGRTVAARGSAVLCRVLSTSLPSPPHSPGYLRLTIVSVAIGDKATSVHTSGAALRARTGTRDELEAGNSKGREIANSVSDVPDNGFLGRRFTVRLTQDIILPN